MVVVEVQKIKNDRVKNMKEILEMIGDLIEEEQQIFIADEIIEENVINESIKIITSQNN